MEVTRIKLPETIEEDELLRMPATWAEYVELSEKTTHTTQFLNGEIIVSQASSIHELLVGMLIWLFNTRYMDDSSYLVLGSNVKIVIPDKLGDVNADLSIVKEPVKYGLTLGGELSTTRIENPVIVVEVLSKSTRKFDLNEKQAYYKLIPSLKYILFVDQDQPFASVYARTETPDEWLNTDYRTLESTVRLGDITLPMAAIYRKITF